MPNAAIHTISCDEAISFVCDAAWGMAKVSPEGNFEWLNPAYCEILNAPALMIIGTNFKVWTHPEDVGQDIQMAQDVASGKIPGYQFSKRYVQRGSTPHNERIIWGLLSVVGQWKDNQFVGYLVQFQPYQNQVPQKISVVKVLSSATLILNWMRLNWGTILTIISVVSALILGNWDRLDQILQKANSVKQSVELVSPQE
jgi:hypothetical protein